MKTLKILGGGLLRTWPRFAADVDPDQFYPELCPAAQCSRCGYEFLPYVASAVCPRCLEPFSREMCYGGCSNCPLR